jgi:hypothetical protein
MNTIAILTPLKKCSTRKTESLKNKYLFKGKHFKWRCFRSSQIDNVAITTKRNFLFMS